MTAPNAAAVMLASTTINQVVADPLMVALAMIVDEELGERTAKMPLTNRNEAVQVFLFDRANKPLRMRIAVRRAERCPDDARTGRFEQVSNRGALLPIPVADQRRRPSSTPSPASGSWRTIWSMKASSGCGVEPTMQTRRECNSITNTV